MGQIEDLRLFVSVVESGGIARAAEELNIAKSAVSRRLAQLEDRYSMRLIDRQPRVFEVTTAGQELYQRASQMVADADELDADFTQENKNLKGPLSVSIAREFGLSYLKPALFRFIEQHPEIELTADFDDRRVDLDRSNYDMAIRISGGELTGLVAIPLGVSHHGLYASRAYLDTYGDPKNLDALTQHKLLYYGAARRASWEFICNGKRKTIHFQPVMNSNSGDCLRDAALDGIGIARLPDFVVSQDKSSEALITILPDCEIEAWRINLVYSAKRRLNKRMRALIETLQSCCTPLVE